MISRRSPAGEKHRTGRTSGRAGLQLPSLLVDAARVLASSLDVEATLRQITGLLVPQAADYCRVLLLAPDGSGLRQVAVAHVDADRVALVRELGAGAEAPGVLDVINKCGETRRPTLVPAWRPGGSPSALYRELAPRSFAVVPLVARDVPLGTLLLTTSVSGRRYDAADEAFRQTLELFGARAALALDNARLHTEVVLAHERELRTSHLEAQLMQARLESLRAQLNPHFLFNALNTIAMLVRRQANADALRGIVGLSQLLRQVLDRRSTPEVRLGEELALVEHYFAIEQLRFRDKLEFGVRVTPEVLDAQVPSLLLQPLVENAVRHGIGASAEGGRIDIVGSRRDDTLNLEVRDNGPGFPEGWSSAACAGVGLANTRERLQRLYGAKQRFELRNAPGGGAVVILRIPFRAAPAA